METILKRYVIGDDDEGYITMGTLFLLYSRKEEVRGRLEIHNYSNVMLYVSETSEEKLIDLCENLLDKITDIGEIWDIVAENIG